MGMSEYEQKEWKKARRPEGLSQTQIPRNDYDNPKREFSWEECSIEQKIERMHLIVKDQNRQLQMLSKEVHRLRVLVFGHYHQDGKILTEPDKFNSLLPQTNSSNEFF